eukprot:GHVP01036477.1.p1 GENE.GHVP01036477.1~~GHVP01036477.1.p1  ORF type:complete len:112 (-),score=6.85 GHVP01036477.1:420-755(-)
MRSFTIAIEHGDEDKKYYQLIMTCMPYIPKDFRFCVGINYKTKKPIFLPLAYGRTWRIHDCSGYGRNYFNRVCANCEGGNLCIDDCRDLKEFGGYDVNGRHHEPCWNLRNL